jgi:uncharacterized membrane protein YuzA (DUF378 family)
MQYLHKITLILLIIGGFNYLLGSFISGWDLSMYLFEFTPMLYMAIGIAAVYEILTHMGRCRECKKK